MNSRTMLLVMVITLGLSGCQNIAAAPESLSPTTGPASPTPANPEAVIGEPIIVGSPEVVTTVAIKTPLPEPSVPQGQLLLTTPTPFGEGSSPILPTETSLAATLPVNTPTLKPTPTPQPTPMPTPSAANSASPTPIVYPTTTWRPPQITAAGVPDDWLTYVDEEAGYSFKYPPEFHLSAGTSKGNKFNHVHVSFPPSGEFRPYMIVTIDENINNLTVEQYLSRRYIDSTKQSNVPTEYLAAMEKITINGFPSVWSKAEGVSEVLIIIDANDKFFNLSISNGIIVSDLRTVDDKSKDIFYQIVNTFTLLSK